MQPSHAHPPHRRETPDGSVQVAVAIMVIIAFVTMLAAIALPVVLHLLGV